MQFLLNGLPCSSPSVLLQTCEDNEIDPSPWLGKANCFVDRHGVDPSYGYFLIDSTLRATIVAISDDPNSGGNGAYTVLGGSNKASLTIQFTDGGPPRTIPDLYLESIVNVTPALNATDAIYLVKLVDARFVFNTSEASKHGRSHASNLQWFNKVEAYLSPAELQYEFDLDEEPEFGHFIYDEDTVFDYHIDTDEQITIGTKDGSPVKIDTPLSWEELFAAIFSLFTDNSRSNVDPVFPYWELNDYTLTLNFDSEIFPPWVPQDISLRDRSARDVLYELLFWSGTSFRYEGEGVFHFFKVENKVVGAGSTQTDQLNEYLSDLYNPFEIKHLTIETGSECVPEGFSVHYPILDTEKADNQKQDYETRYVSLDPSEQPPDVPRGRKVPKIQIPIVWISERRKNISPGAGNEMPDAEYAGLIEARASSRFQDEFRRYPPMVRDYGGFVTATPQPFLDRVSWYSLGGTPGTKIESKLSFEWDVMEPLPIFPREPKLSVIIAKVKQDVQASSTTFEFEEARLLVGQLFPTVTAYNTVKRSYTAGEEVILIGGQIEKWRHKSLLFDNPDYAYDQLYFTIDDIPYLRLKLQKQYLEQLGSDINQGWKYPLEQVEVVNGKLPQPDDNEEEADYIYIVNSPKIRLDDDDDTIYVAYDHTVGGDVYHRWTVADSANDILFLKGLDGYVLNPTEPSEGQRRLVLKSPGPSGEAIGWLEEASDGRTDEELEQFIITIINENGGTGSGGGSTMMRALVDKAGGVKSTDTTFNYSGASVLVSDGAVLPATGVCDNTFNTPFVHNEPILIIRKNNGVWTAIKIQHNTIVGSPASTVKRNDSTFNITINSAIEGTQPDTAVGVGDGQAYMQGEPLIFTQTNDNKWRVIDRTETTGLFRTTQPIGQASYNNTTGVLTIGTGQARKLVESTTVDSSYSTETPLIVIKNMTNSSIPANKNLQCKKIGRYWFVDVENCS